MGLKKGQTNNLKGRPKGAANKVSNDLRAWVNSFVESNTAQIEKDFKKLDAKDRLVMFERLLKYVLPALQSAAVTVDFETMDEATIDRIIDELKKSSNG